MIAVTSSIYSGLQGAVALFGSGNANEWIVVGAVAGLALAKVARHLGQRAVITTSNEVEQIYLPPRMEDFDYGPYREKIKKCRQDPRCVGIALAKKEDGSLHPIYIIGESWNSHEAKFCAKNLADDKGLGFVRAHEEIGSAGREVHIDLVKNETEQDFQENGVKRTRREFKNIGINLLKCVLQKFSNCENRAMLRAMGNSGPYYYRQGYRIRNPKRFHLNAVFADLVKQGENLHDFGCDRMYLSDRARKLWAEEIIRNPIGFPK